MKKISLFSRCTYKVLQRHRAVDIFCANIKNLSPVWFKRYGKGLNVLELIEKSNGVSPAFIWERTMEGYEFWHKIDCEVDNLLKTYYHENI